MPDPTNSTTIVPTAQGSAAGAGTWGSGRYSRAARLVRTQRKALAIWGALYLVALVAMMAMIAPAFGEMMTFQQNVMAAQAAHLPPPPMPGSFIGGILLFELVVLVLLVMIFAAAVRATALGGDDRFGFLRLGMDELRLIGLGVGLVVAFYVGLFVLGLAIGLVAVVIGVIVGAGGGASSASGPMIAVLVVAWLAIMAATIWAEVRISLAGVLTVLRGRIVVREAWRLTRGRFWTLLGAYLIFGVAYVAVTLVMLAITNPALPSAMAGGMQPAAMQTATLQSQAMMLDPLSPRMIVTWLVGAVVFTVAFGFVFGAITTAAIGFEGEAAGAPVD